MSQRVLILKAHAKINLDLRITRIRDDGYHDIATVFQSLDLHDTVTMEPREGPLTVRSGQRGVPVDGDNLCARAAAQMWRAFGRRGTPGDWCITLDKRVPMEAGLGGGSSDAAATLLGLALAWDVDLQDARLQEAAAAVGADVSYFLVGGTVLGLGRGDQLVPLPDVSRAEVVLVQPPFGLATADVYRWYDELAAVSAVAPAADSVAACRNDLEWPAAIRHAELQELAVRLRASGARLAAMTGSGSVVFGLFDRADAADYAADLLRDGASRVIRTRTLGRAAYQLSMRGEL
jgi:4-diphosphocytidyl-2-C-methyl-D-erythritol kinase